ncbi:hypothetical protein AB4Y44_42245 [Paraburkholderia sp. BR10937]|uniref:hypothetical protein n=1 Tax=Paraburkholderia sp. BR10937 TaxID=3236994 RepID=UPI0034D2F5ED
MTQWYFCKPFLLVAATVVVLYAADAVYPTWSWECRGRGYTSNDESLPIVALEIPELGQNVDKRAMHVSHPQGCSIHANNIARRVFDWWVSD